MWLLHRRESWIYNTPPFRDWCWWHRKHPRSLTPKRSRARVIIATGRDYSAEPILAPSSVSFLYYYIVYSSFQLWLGPGDSFKLNRFRRLLPTNRMWKQNGHDSYFVGDSFPFRAMPRMHHHRYHTYDHSQKINENQRKSSQQNASNTNEFVLPCASSNANGSKFSKNDSDSERVFVWLKNRKLRRHKRPTPMIGLVHPNKNKTLWYQIQE